MSGIEDVAAGIFRVVYDTDQGAGADVAVLVNACRPSAAEEDEIVFDAIGFPSSIAGDDSGGGGPVADEGALTGDLPEYESGR